MKEKIELEIITKILEEEEMEVEWTGEKFEVKPMKLYRVNLAELKTSASIAVASVQVHKYESVQTIPVRVSYNGTADASSLTPELVQARLRDELAAVKRELNAKDSTTEGKLQELVNIDSQLQDGQNNLQKGLNQVVGRMGSAEGKLASLPGEEFLAYE